MTTTTTTTTMSSHFPTEEEEMANIAQDRPLRQSHRIERRSYVEEDALDVAEALEDSDVELEIDFGPNSNQPQMKDDTRPAGNSVGVGGRGAAASSSSSTTTDVDETGLRENEDVIVGGEEEYPDSVVNDFKSEIVDGKALYFCSECNYQSNSSNNLKRHVAAVHKKMERFPCPHCKFVSYYRDNVRRHIQTVHDLNAQKYSCSLCEFTTVHVESLRRHEALHREKMSNTNDSGDAPGFFSCHKCSFSTEVESLWLSHENNCASLSPAEKTKDGTITSSVSTIANVSMSDDATAKYDIDSLPTLTSPEKIFQDTFSPAAASSAASSAALTTSTATTVVPAAFSRTYTCQVCKYSTTKSRLFLYHQINEHSARFHVYPCDRCDYATRYRNKLHRHQKMVHGLDLPKYSRSALHLNADLALSSAEPSVFTTTLHAMSSSGRTSKTGSPFFRFSKMPPRSFLDSSISVVLSSRGKWRFKCRHCFFSCGFRRVAMHHARAQHKNLLRQHRNYDCLRCEFTSSNAVEFLLHKSKHTSKTLRCSSCSYSTKREEKMRFHEKKHDLSSKCRFRCQGCGFPAYRESTLMSHIMRRHPGVDPLGIGKDAEQDPEAKQIESEDNASGGEMRATFSSESDLRTTVLKVDPNKQLKCDFCNAIAKSIPELQAHIVANHKGATLYQCTKCLSSYKRAADLNRHLKQKHGFNQGDWRKRRWREENHNYLAPYLRKIQPSVVIHANSDNSETSDAGTEAESGAENSTQNISLDSEVLHPAIPLPNRNYYNQRFSCPFCSKTYKWKGDLNVHLRRAHGISAPSAVRDNENKKGIYPCPLCPYVGKWKSEIQRHERIHTKTKPYGCGYCDYRSSWRGDMTRHLDKYHPNENRKVLHFEGGNAERVDKVEEDPQDAEAALRQAMQRRMERDEEASSLSPLPPHLQSTKDTTDGDESEGSSSSDVERERRRRKRRNELRKYAAQFAIRRNSESERNTYPVVEEGSMPEKVEANSANEDAHSDMEEEVDVGSPQDENPLMQMDVNTEEEKREESFTADDLRREILKKMTEHQDSSAMVSDATANAAAVDAVMMAMMNNAAVTSDSDAAKATKLVLDNGTKCPQCDFVAPAPSKLRAHMIVHSNIKPFKCTGCGKRANWKWDINKHIRASTKCGMAQVVELPPDEAESTIQDYLEQCNQEGSSYHHHQRRASSLSEPTSDGDGAESSQEAPGPSERSTLVGASDAQTTYSSPQFPNASFVTTQAPGTAAKVTSTPVVGKKHNYMRPFKCSECGKRSNWKWDLRKHIGQAHEGTAKIVVLSLEEAEATLTTYLESRNQLPVHELDTRFKTAKAEPRGDSTEVKSLSSFIPTSNDSAPFLKRSFLEAMNRAQAGFSSFVAPAQFAASNYTIPNFAAPLFPQWVPTSMAPPASLDKKRIISGDSAGVASSSGVTDDDEGGEEELTFEEDGKESIVTSIPEKEEEEEGPTLNKATNGTEEKVFRCSHCATTTSMRGDMINHIEIQHPGLRIAYKVVKTAVNFEFHPIHSPGQSNEAIQKPLFDEQPKEFADAPIKAYSAHIYSRPQIPDFQPVCTEKSEPLSPISTVSAEGGFLDKRTDASVVQPSTPVRSAQAPPPTSTEITPPMSSPFKADYDSQQPQYRSPSQLYPEQQQYRRWNEVEYKVNNDPLQQYREAALNLVSRPLKRSLSVDSIDQEHQLSIDESREGGQNLSQRYADDEEDGMDHDGSSDEEGEERMEMSLDLSRSTNHEASPQSMSASATSPRITPPKKHVCNICPYKTSKIALLDLHNQHHTPSEANPHKCSFCDYWVCAKRLLKQHTRLHTGLPPPPSQPKPQRPANQNKPAPKLPAPLMADGNATAAALAAASAAAATAATAGLFNRFSEKDLQQLLMPFASRESIMAAENNIGGLPTMVPMPRSSLPLPNAMPHIPPASQTDDTPTTSVFNALARPSVGGKCGKAPRPLTASGHPISGDVERSRPFMCSACRKRSNWKWDIMKHIREKHADGGGLNTVIELSTEEAKSTLNDYLRQRNQRPIVTLANGEIVAPSGSSIVAHSPSFVSSSTDKPASSQSVKKFFCDQCPYATKSCKDSIYHKQFHHYSPANPLKCPHCDYWVSHRGKLTQHLKFHEATGIFAPRSSEGVQTAVEVEDEEEEEGDGERLPPGISKEQAVFASLLDLSPAPRSESDGPGSFASSNVVALKNEEQKVEPSLPVPKKETHPTQPHLPPSKIHRQQIADSNLRPFLCSVCGKRSNWKWDITKHIRSNHADISDARVVEMSFEDLENLASIAAAAAAVSAASTLNHPIPSSVPLSNLPSPSLNTTPKFHHNDDFRPLSPVYDSDSQENEYPVKQLQQHLQQQQRLLNADLSSQRNLMGSSAIPAGAGGYVVNKSGHLTKDGGFRKLHRCKYCPYTNVRKVNLQLHEKMHGRNVALDGKDLIQCPYCDYTVGNKGLLSHHLKVHMEKPNIYEDADPSILPIDHVSSSAAESKLHFDSLTTPAAIAAMAVSAAGQRPVFPDGNNFHSDEDSSEEVRPSMGHDSPNNLNAQFSSSSSSVVDRHVPRFFCIRCPYSTENHIHYQRHLEMHGSQQRFSCSSCDYSVGTLAQLEHHKLLHGASSSEDVVTASGYATSSSGISSLDDHLRHQDPHSPLSPTASSPRHRLNNDEYFAKPKSIHSSSSSGNREAFFHLYDDGEIDLSPSSSYGALSYKCAKCPQIESSRDRLLAHLRSHSKPSIYTCQVCGFGVTTQHSLSQHLRVHTEAYTAAVANNMNNIVVLGNDDDGCDATAARSHFSSTANASHSQSKSSVFSPSSSSKSSVGASPDGPIDLSSKPKNLDSSTNVEDSDQFGARKLGLKGNPYSLYSRMSAVPIKDSIKELRNFAKSSSSSFKDTASSSSTNELYAKSPVDPADSASTKFGGGSGSALFPSPSGHQIPSPSSVTASQLEFAREHLVRAATALAASHAAASTSELLQSQRNAAFKDASLSLAQAALVSRQHPALALGEAEGEESGDTMWVCQFCDVGFTASAKLVQHEMEHLLGHIKN